MFHKYDNDNIAMWGCLPNKHAYVWRAQSSWSLIMFWVFVKKKPQSILSPRLFS